jgi:phage protein D
MWRRPVLQIVNGGGRDILPGLSGLWLSCRVTEKAGDESDEAEILCVGPPSRFGLPGRGETFIILGGWRDEGPVMQGRFTVQKITMAGDPDSGDTIAISLRAADYVDKLKAHGSKHYDDKTFGDLVRDVAQEAGLEASVDEEIGKIKIPYALRWQQSPIDFLREHGERIGALVKPAGGKLMAVKRGSGKSASGKALSPITIQRRRAFGYSIETEARPEHGHVAAAWHKDGKRKMVKEKTGRDGPIYTLPHPYQSEDDAKKAAKAEAYEQGVNSGTGHFDSPGLPHAHAEAPVTASGFGWPIDGRWKAEEVVKEWSSTGGFVTTVSVSAGDEGKGKKNG